MEGGGGRKRKAGVHLEIDWDKLLGNNEPPPAPEVLMLGEDDESHKNQYLQGLPDRELAEKISRAEKMLINPSKLPDGGSKLRACLKRYIVERERRKLLKADDKCKKVTLLADEPIRIDSTDDLASRGAPTSISAYQSQFGLSFCSKLNNERPAKSFTNKMSTLNRCDYKKENGPFVDLRSQKVGLSSRPVPFKFLKHLSVQANDSSQSNREHFRHHSSTPSPRQPDKCVSGYFEKKENVLRVQPMPSSKMNNVLLCMEGGGRKRKAGVQLELDWDKLLRDFSPPPPAPVVVIDESKSKPQAPEVLTSRGDDESHKDIYLQGLPDGALAEKISRTEKLLINPSNLPDGGIKLRARLKRQIAERERRKLLKADIKCKKTTLLSNKPIRTDATDDLASRGAPPSLSASQSQFASSFCSKLDNMRPAKSFTNSAENILVNPSKFPDGVAKLRVLLKRQIAERKRRKLLKADDELLEDLLSQGSS